MHYFVTHMHIFTGSVRFIFNSGGNVFIKSSDASEHLSTIFLYRLEIDSCRSYLK